MDLFGRPLDEVCELDVDEIAMLLLVRLQGRDPLSRWNESLAVKNEVRGQGGSEAEASLAAQVLVEAWQWLRSRALIVSHPEKTDPGWETLSRAARAMDPPRYLAELRVMTILREAYLEPTLAEQVGPLFRRGQFDLAVVAATRLLEVRVRDLAGLSADDTGVPLMQKAFGRSGKFYDVTLTSAENQARMALFWGAMGFYRNPPSHRFVALDDPQEAAEIVLFVNQLLRQVERDSDRLNKHDA